MLVLILECMEREGYSYTMVPIRCVCVCVGGFIFKFIGSGNHPPWKDVLKKKTGGGLGKTKVKEEYGHLVLDLLK